MVYHPDVLEMISKCLYICSSAVFLIWKHTLDKLLDHMRDRLKQHNTLTSPLHLSRYIINGYE